jgi:hypothetical protein
MDALDDLQKHKVVDVSTCSGVKKDLVLAYVGERQRRAAFADQATKFRDKQKLYPPGAKHTIQKLRSEVRALKSINATSNLTSRKSSLIQNILQIKTSTKSPAPSLVRGYSHQSFPELHYFIQHK